MVADCEEDLYVEEQLEETEFHPPQVTYRGVNAVRFRSIACQAPTTYRWKWTKPRFKLLPAAAHGCDL